MASLRSIAERGRRGGASVALIPPPFPPTAIFPVALPVSHYPVLVEFY